MGRNSNTESGPLIYLGRESDRTTHHIDQALGNCQSQPGAPILAGCGRVGLGEGLKQVLLYLLSNADASVKNFKFERRGLRNKSAHDLHTAVLGKLDCVTHQVDKD